MTALKGSTSQRLAWIEGIRFFAAVALVPYHAQLFFTNYAFTPQPTGLSENLTTLAAASDRFGALGSLLSCPLWFGYQFVDVFVLISGFSLVLSLKGKPLELFSFLKQRLLRILWPFWTAAWLSYPVLWAIGTATNSYVPDHWHIFAGASFPLLFDYASDLLPTSGPWWFMPLILSFAIVFPFLWHLQQRWGSRNLLIVSMVVTIAYRALAVYAFSGHPTYVVLDTAASWQPFLSFLAKLSTFVVGMVVAQAYLVQRGPIYWSASRAFWCGIAIYAVGFICQFYWAGWVIADLLLPIGLLLWAMAIFRALARIKGFATVMVWLGAHSYSYFLIHNFVVDRTVNLLVNDRLSRYWLLLPVMLLGTLLLAVVVDALIPLLQRILAAIGRDLDYVLTQTNPAPRSRLWQPAMGDRVCYRGERGWTVTKVEQLLDDQPCFLCQISDGHRTMWQSEDELELDREALPERYRHSRNRSTPHRS